MPTSKFVLVRQLRSQVRIWDVRPFAGGRTPRWVELLPFSQKYVVSFFPFFFSVLILQKVQFRWNPLYLPLLGLLAGLVDPKVKARHEV